MLPRLGRGLDEAPYTALASSWKAFAGVLQPIAE